MPSAKPLKIALLAITPRRPVEVATMPVEFPGYGVRRVAASLRADPGLSHAEIRLFDEINPDVDKLVAFAEDFDADIIGLSLFVWSLPTLLEAARRLKARRPDRRVIAGGPSARVSMFELEPWREAGRVIDVLVTGEGEVPARQLLALPDFSQKNLARVPGIAYWSEERWVRSAAKDSQIGFDDLPSPYDYGLAPKGALGYLETFRGCPFSCRFCEWGSETHDPRRYASVESLAKELENFKKNRAEIVFDCDAGLNLNTRALANLARAEAEVGCLKNSAIIAQVYPSLADETLFNFLSRVQTKWLGVGLQSYDPAVCELHDRHFRTDRFEEVLRRLVAAHSGVAIQIILGLPGDSPAGFRRTILKSLEIADALPCQLEVYYCLILPDALLDRALPSFDIRFDPRTMRLKSCLGWTERDLAQATAWMDELTTSRGGTTAQGWWDVPNAGPGKLAMSGSH